MTLGVSRRLLDSADVILTIHGCSRTPSAVRRESGSTLRSLWTRSLAKSETLDHSGSSNTTLPSQIDSNRLTRQAGQSRPMQGPDCGKNPRSTQLEQADLRRRDRVYLLLIPTDPRSTYCQSGFGETKHGTHRLTIFLTGTAPKRSVARKENVDDDTERPKIAAFVVARSRRISHKHFNNFGSHILSRPHGRVQSVKC